MAHPTGRRVRLSVARRFISDLVYFAQKTPLTTMQRKMNLATVARAREQCVPRPGWAALFLKAYGRVAMRHPTLRWAYIPWPWPHFYEHPESNASVAIERRVEEEDCVFFLHLRGPEHQTLADIDAHLCRGKEDPIESIPVFRRIVKTTRWPRLVRRLLWRFGLFTSGHRRARHLGTFGLSTVASQGALILNLLTPLTTAINFGPLADDGSVEVQLAFDHRVLDGGTVARVLGDLEQTLQGEILEELRGMQSAGQKHRQAG